MPERGSWNIPLFQILSPNSDFSTRVCRGAPMTACLPPEASRLAVPMPCTIPQGHRVPGHHVTTSRAATETLHFRAWHSLAQPGTAKLANFSAQNGHLFECREPTKNFHMDLSTVLECSQAHTSESAIKTTCQNTRSQNKYRY